MKLILTLVIVFFTTTAFAQQKVEIKTPSPSPEAKIKQMLGNTEVTIAYARPLARGRKVFGELVPYDSLWRTGASDATSINISDDINISGTKLKKGKYSLFTIPTATTWTIIINTDTTLHGTSGYKKELDVVRFKVPSKNIKEDVNTFSINIVNISNRYSADIQILWEKTEVLIPISSLDDEKFMGMIKENVIDKKSTDAESLYQSANYYYTTTRDLKQAATWLETACALDSTNFYYPNLLQKVYADSKEYKKAIVAAEKAVVLGEKKGMKGTVANLKKRILSWKKL